MEVILKQDVNKLGYKDDVVRVKPGYGRNFLIPRGYAIIANEQNRKVLAENLKQRAFKEEKIKKEAEETAKVLQAKAVKVAVKVGENGRIFGSVTPLHLAEAIGKMGFNVERKNISFPEDQIKTIGKYTATIRLHKEVVIKLEFEVIAE